MKNSVIVIISETNRAKKYLQFFSVKDLCSVLFQHKIHLEKGIMRNRSLTNFLNSFFISTVHVLVVDLLYKVLYVLKPPFDYVFLFITHLLSVPLASTSCQQTKLHLYSNYSDSILNILSHTNSLRNISSHPTHRDSPIKIYNHTH